MTRAAVAVAIVIASLSFAAARSNPVRTFNFASA
jgi:hypothetical protein